MIETFKPTIEQYPFDKDGITSLKILSQHGEDWPVVYILNGDKEAYVGETQSAYDRMMQHYANKGTSRKNLTRISLIQSNSFNKSAILDIENMLITHMHADGKFVLQNANGGQSRLHNYYQRTEYQSVFVDIWKELKRLDIVNHDLYTIENSEIFKFSPYKELTGEQYDVVKDLLELYPKAMQGSSRTDVIVNGGAGTGKSLIAIYFINVIVNILNNNYDFSDTVEYLDDESFFNRASLIKSIKTHGNTKIGFVVAAESFRKTVKKIFHSIKGLKHIHVLSPIESTRGDYDVLVVDEAHRLKRRKAITNYRAFDKACKSLGFPKESTTELDWLKLKAKKMLILFYDEKQTVKESDVLEKDFSFNNAFHFYLETQLRVKGGNEYIEFVHRLFSNQPRTYKVQKGYEVKVFNDCYEMFEEIKKKNAEYNGLCRMLAGLSFYWRKKARDKKSTQYKQDFDFEIDGHHYCWNEDFNACDFITNDEYIDRIGCIYTSQGYDLNFAGVILGKDISYNPEKKQIEYHTDEFIDTYSKSADIKKTISNIIHAYLILLTRGMYGTYIYAVDKNLREYIKSLIQ